MAKQSVTLYSGYVENLRENEILVFGSNPQGWHGKGLALIAKQKFGAIQGVGRGLQGKCYGLITKNMKKNFIESCTTITYSRVGAKSVSPEQIIYNIAELYETAIKYKEKKFLIGYTKSGLNLNGYTDIEMAKMFVDAGTPPDNIIFEREFYEELILKK